MSALALIALLAQAGVAYAEGPVATGGAIGRAPQAAPPVASASAPAAAPWTSPEYHACEGICLYQKANEHLSLQALYVIYKADAIKKEKDLSLVRNHLGEASSGGFCLSGEGSSDCRDRFVQVQVANLKNIKKAIEENSVTIQQHNSLSMASRLRVLPPEPKIPQLPWVPTIDEISKEMPRAQALSPEAYQKWVDTKPLKPNRSDFYVMETIPRDPGNPKAGEIRRYKLGSDGNPVVNEEAYKNAMKRYESLFKADSVADQKYKDMKDQYKSDQQRPYMHLQADKDAYRAARQSMIESMEKKKESTQSRVPASAGAAASKSASKNFDSYQIKKPEPTPENNSETVIFEPNDLLREIDNLNK